MTKRTKESLRRLSQRFPEDLKFLEEAHLGQSDRACALIVSAAIDHHLMELIRAHLVIFEEEQIDNSLFFGDQAILGTLSSKIAMSYAMGLITEVERRDLQTIRAVRNAFAHTIEPIAFDTKEIAESCAQLENIEITSANANLTHIPKVRFLEAARTLACAILGKTAVALEKKTDRLSKYLSSRKISSGALGNDGG